MTELRFRPLQQYPKPFTPDDKRKARPFRQGFEDTRRKLLEELSKLRATEAEIQLAVLPSEIRRDGSTPLASAKAAHPGVVLWAHTPEHGELTWHADSCRDWRDNVRAIALTMERLRLADLYDVMRGAQYRGFAALPAPAGESFRTKDEARAYLGKLLGLPVLAGDEQAAVRTALKIAHPDTGGSAEELRRVMAAREKLEA